MRPTTPCKPGWIAWRTSGRRWSSGPLCSYPPRSAGEGLVYIAGMHAYAMTTTVRLTSAQKRKLQEAQAILQKRSTREISQGEAIGALDETITTIRFKSGRHDVAAAAGSAILNSTSFERVFSRAACLRRRMVPLPRPRGQAVVLHGLHLVRPHGEPRHSPGRCIRRE